MHTGPGNPLPTETRRAPPPIESQEKKNRVPSVRKQLTRGTLSRLSGSAAHRTAAQESGEGGVHPSAFSSNLKPQTSIFHFPFVTGLWRRHPTLLHLPGRQALACDP